MKYTDRKTNLTLLILSLLALLLVSIVILSGVPPVSRDALTHHLAVPKLYLKHGGMYEIPSLTFSYYPMNLDLLYIVPLYFGNDIVPKFIHFTFALLTAWLVFSYLQKRLNRVYALAGALFFLSLPVILKLSTTVYVDLGLIFFSTWSLIYLLKWIEKQFHIQIPGCIGGCLRPGTGHQVQWPDRHLSTILFCAVSLCKIPSRPVPEGWLTSP